MIKLFIASYIYPEFIQLLYKQDPSLIHKPYSEQYTFLMSQCFGWSDFWKLNLEATGKYKVEQVVVNAEIMQKKWANENNVSIKNDSWALTTLKNQILQFQPDILFTQDSKSVTPKFRKKIRKDCSSIKLTVAWDCIKMNDAARFEGTDIMMTCLDSIESYYKGAGFKTLLLPFGFEKTILDRIKKSPPKYDFTFVGSLIPFMNGHFSRLRLLDTLLYNTNINLWISGINPTLFNFLAFQLATLSRGKTSDLYDQLKLFPAFRKAYRKSSGRAFGLDMYQILSDSKITLNSHIDAAGELAGNVRLWEATGVGTCLITDWKENLNDLFIIDKEIVAYKSAEECIEKVKYLLNNDDEREQIARAGQKKTLEHYSFANRLELFTNYIEPLL